MPSIVDVAEHRRNNKDLPPKNRVWGFRVPARHRIRKSASQVTQVHREIRLTVTITVSGIVDWYINDHLGTPQRMIDGTGAVVWAADYTAFGKATVTTPTVENNLRFPGQYYDAETGLHYNWNRYYDPQLGRYLSTDPIGIRGGLNLYSYVHNSPSNGFDNLGLCPDVPMDDPGLGNGGTATEQSEDEGINEIVFDAWKSTTHEVLIPEMLPWIGPYYRALALFVHYSELIFRASPAEAPTSPSDLGKYKPRNP